MPLSCIFSPPESVCGEIKLQAVVECEHGFAASHFKYDNHYYFENKQDDPFLQVLFLALILTPHQAKTYAW